MPFGLWREFLFSGIFALMLTPPPVHGQDAERGQRNAQTCAACHGENGISPSPSWPNLAGQKEEYFILQMEAYRRGDRRNPIMTPIAQPLSDEDIRDLAAYYAKMSP